MPLPDYAMNQSSFPESYERWIVGPLFRPFAELTVEQLAVTQDESLIDIACGTGIVSRVARERLGSSARIVGIDVSPGMLAVARRVAPDIDWREGDAGALPLADGERFDVAVCQQGLQFFPDKPGATAEMRRALTQGGRLAVSTWRPDDEMPVFRDLRRIAEHHLGPVADQRHAFGEAGPIETLLGEAGLRDIRSVTLTRTVRFADIAAFLRMNAMALVGMSAAGKAADDRERARLVEAIVGDSFPVANRHTEMSVLAFEVSANLVTARG